MHGGKIRKGWLPSCGSAAGKVYFPGAVASTERVQLTGAVVVEVLLPRLVRLRVIE
jgi:hypothetical protein